MNPVDIWEGIDTHEETGRNRLTKLAIHILSIVANSAGCERAFSYMGLIHTGIRSRLGAEKVRKTAMVGMDIKRMHLEAGLLHARTKRMFMSQPGTSTSERGQEPDLEPGSAADHLDLGDSDDLLDFDQLSGDLIAGAAAANADKDVGDDYDDDENPPTAPSVPALPLTITIPPLNSATLPDQATHINKTSIPLQILFKYPTNADQLSDGMNSFWKGGIQNLEKEMEAYEILSSSEEAADGTNLDIPSTGMQVD